MQVNLDTSHPESWRSRRQRSLPQRLIVVTIASVFWIPPATADDTNTALVAIRNDDGILVTEEGKPVLQYQLKTKSVDGAFARSNYVHPLHDLDGKVITEDFPADHKHHRGIFWAWHQVWVGDKKIGDPWVCRDFSWKTKSSGFASHPDGSVNLLATIDWQSPHLVDDSGGEVPIAQEQVRITVHPSTKHYRFVDFRIELKALQPDLKIGGSEDVKGYGGFSLRLLLSPDAKFVSTDGEVEPVKTAVTAGPWMDISNESSGVAIFCHPKNPGSPEPWILRRQRSMQNAVYPGRKPTIVSMEKPTILRYRLVIHKGTENEVPPSDIYKQYLLVSE